MRCPSMRVTPIILAMLFLAACERSPAQQQMHDIKEAADNRADKLEADGKVKAEPLDTQAKALRTQADQAGGYEGKRLDVQAEALEKQADLIRAQAHDRAEAVRAAADAQVKALQSR